MIIMDQKERSYFYFSLTALLVSGSFIWAFWPVFSDLVQLWSNNEDYSHGFFVIPLMIYLIFKKQGAEKCEKPSYVWIGLLGVVGGLLLYIIGLFSQFRTLMYFSLILACWGSVFFLFGYHFFKKFAWELFLIVFMVPIPSRLYASMTLPLQLIVTKISFIVLQVLGIPVYREGNILHLSNTSVEVVNACSGLRSILMIILMSFVISCLFLPRFLHRLLLVAFAVPLAMLSNLVRVTLLALFALHGNTYFVEGVGHTLLGLALFALNLVLLMILVRGIEWGSAVK